MAEIGGDEAVRGRTAGIGHGGGAVAIVNVSVARGAGGVWIGGKELLLRMDRTALSQSEPTRQEKKKEGGKVRKTGQTNNSPSNRCRSRSFSFRLTEKSGNG